MRISLLVMMIVCFAAFVPPVSAAFESPDGQELQCSCTCVSKGTPVATADNQASSSVSIDYVPSMVVISEFVSDPISGEREWVELYNRSDEVIDLDGWQLLEGSEQVTKLDGVLLPDTYIVFKKSSLNNSGDQLVLRAPDQVVVDSVTYGDFDDGDISDNAPATQDPFSIIRKDVSVDYNDDAREFAVTTFVTKEKPNVLITIDSDERTTTSVEDSPSADDPEVDVALEPVYDNATTVVITEFLPNPVGSDIDGGEWIELFNTGTEDVSLLGWMLDDESGGSTPYVFEDDVVIAAGGYVVITNDVTALQLNNTTDQVRLMHHDETVVDQVGYSSVVEGQSYSLISDEWLWTSESTPGEKNTVSAVPVEPDIEEQEDVVPLVAVEDVSTLPLDSMVRITGVVVATPGVLGSRVMYVDGLQIYNSKSEWPAISLFDSVTITGKVSESSGERRLLASSKEDYVVGAAVETVVPLSLTAEEMGVAHVGRLVSLQGTALEKDGSKVIFGDDTDEFIVYFRESTGTSAKSVTTGEVYTMTGVVSVYQGEYRLLPRSADDIVVPVVDESSAVDDPVAAGFLLTPEVVTAPPMVRTSPLFILMVLLLTSVVAGIGGFVWWQRDKIKVFIQQFRVNKQTDVT